MLPQKGHCQQPGNPIINIHNRIMKLISLLAAFLFPVLRLNAEELDFQK